jgi:membrane fusion protein, multidrug efflux system
MANQVAEDVKTEAPRKRTLKRPGRHRMRLIALIVLLPLLIGGYFLWRYLQSYESTDDAQVDGHIHPISARVGGYLKQVLVNDEQIVKAGDPLVVIDTQDYAVAVARSEGDLAEAQASHLGSRTNVPVTSATTTSTLDSAQSNLADTQAALVSAQRQMDAAEARLKAAEAQVTEAEANYQKAAHDEARYKQLADKDEIAYQTYDEAAQTTAANKAVLDSRIASVSDARQTVAAAAAAVQQAQARIKQAEASVRSAQTWPEQVEISKSQAEAAQARVAQQRAALAQAKLNLSYTTIFAPADGVIDKKTAEVGQNVTPGEQLMALVQLDDVWVIANFKETQLRRMRLGQRVRFSVDAYTRVYHGRVTGIGGATGARTSLLPPENATGNYVKVVQRIPVRIDLEPGENKDHRLRPGMSVDPKVFLE